MFVAVPQSTPNRVQRMISMENSNTVTLFCLFSFRLHRRVSHCTATATAVAASHLHLSPSLFFSLRDHQFRILFASDFAVPMDTAVIWRRIVTFSSGFFICGGWGGALLSLYSNLLRRCDRVNAESIRHCAVHTPLLCLCAITSGKSFSFSEYFLFGSQYILKT